MLQISRQVSIPESEIDIQFVRAQGAGGQNVNKTSTAAHLRFDIPGSSLPQVYKDRLLSLRDHRITADGVVVIKAQRYRTQEQNREDAYARLQALLRSVAATPKPRKSTKPSLAAKRKRLESKTKRSRLKAGRGKVTDF
ncbi:class I peptide chain release factor [Alkalilimnicola ehrlichii]|uniref:Class I peptide chain release factor n=1 Tax=Alkalilimnicola ehrlichii TaxID=351052 RepID=A0A3E0WUP4_9GAMM|nr:alternative ribosome rescue aminoacyl-tRNA hydrolase ArfB [Alkalilimnicola ehrlichii]RFA29996.1 class I peptide chain release factor [Alkalilimnicola ehrlichii]RFA36558.1 class I peptide chain release factor [Alkalilimnicola ehrlichii]